jgi:protein TonB
MRYAVAGSALLHAAAIGGALLVLDLPPRGEDSAPAQTVSVEIITVAAATAVPSVPIESDAAETLVSAGAAPTVNAMEPVVLEEVMEVVVASTPEPSEVPEVVEAVAPSPVVEAVEHVPAEPVPAEAPSVLTALAPDPQETVPQDLIEPSDDSDAQVAPIPRTLTRKRPTEPTQRAKETPPKQQPPPPRQAGNGGADAGDAVAARPSGGQAGAGGAGGDAETARYPSKVQGKLRRALRYPAGARGASGEAHVSFVVNGSGAPTNIAIARTSGNGAIDEAALDTVRRAAPFPPIPASAGRTSWTFTVPLAFVR